MYGEGGLEQIANRAADEAMMAVLANLSTFEGRSRFTTRAYKFTIPKFATEIRRIALGSTARSSSTTSLSSGQTALRRPATPKRRTWLRQSATRSTGH